MQRYQVLSGTRTRSETPGWIRSFVAMSSGFNCHFKSSVDYVPAILSFVLGILDQIHTIETYQRFRVTLCRVL